ncbi:MAG: hypothetical protein COT89_00855 [Candidatus Colwellbacteria bacterium CG10_big_fil_rev_8_21_14_0_10_42_22]|uniref:Nudix hydrolase domain-containing protein n=1 Tax=Candidatus Colwellbacteria bacterium CG10_big_fil_rev_8_21_14_0_10_42_22 TaxID=1974540 RepID=A0A2H0VGL0_9BACT|nr:MAG: hypothetical protein COT89_00855 [Candidatus Colwellbacteria bacterium CG10_big_fil_rev_8_21_14_0_10_42_22]
MKLIPEKLYKKIVTLVPLPCVDLIVVYNGKFLLGKRRIEPEAGKWWPPGGRVLIGEKLLDATERKLKDDLGLRTGYREPKFLLTEETIFKNSKGGYVRHTVNAAYLVKLIKKPDMNFEKSGISDFSEIKWFEKINKNWHPYVRHCLEKAGFIPPHLKNRCDLLEQGGFK